MGLDIWSYDRDRISALSKYNYIKNKYDIFIGSRTKIKFDELYQDTHCSNSQYLRSNYNGYGYDSFARIYNCIELLFILQPILNNYDKNKMIISKESIYQSLGIAKENLQRWKYLELLNEKEQIFRYDVIKYHNNSSFNNVFYTIATNQFIRYNNFTCELINQAKNNLNKKKFNKYLKDYLGKYPEDDTYVKGIIQIDGNILILFKDNISWYRETAEIIVDFIETLLLMEEPVVNYWG